MKTTLEELRKNNGGYVYGASGITEADLRLVNGIIERIEETRTEEPQVLDVVEYTDSFGDYYPSAIIDGDTYHDGSLVVCENGSAHVSVDKEGGIHKSISGGAFPRIDKTKLRYIGKKKKVFWTFSTLGWGANQGLYFEVEVSCFELNCRVGEMAKYSTKDYSSIFVQDWGERRSECGYKYTVTKGCYAWIAFKTKEELDEFLALYEAVEEPYFGNKDGTRKFWCLKQESVSVWTEEDFEKIEYDRQEKSLFNGRYVPTKYKKEGTTLVAYILRSDEPRYV